MRGKCRSVGVDVSRGTLSRQYVVRHQEVAEEQEEEENGGVETEETAQEVVLDERRSLYEGMSDVEGQEVNDIQEAREHSIPLVVEVVDSEQHQQEEEETQNKMPPTSNPERERVRSGFTPRHHDYDAAGTLDFLADKIAGFYKQIPAEQVNAKATTYVMEQRDAPFLALWVEWFSAIGEKPLIRSLDKHAPN